MQKASNISQMKIPGWPLVAISLLLFGEMLLGQIAIGQTAVMPLEQTRKDELKNILLQDCGSCHGMTLKGGLGPALTTDALQGKADIYLQQTILEGHAGTPMPPWKDILSGADIDYLVSLLKAGVAQ